IVMHGHGRPPLHHKRTTQHGTSPLVLRPRITFLVPALPQVAAPARPIADPARAGAFRRTAEALGDQGSGRKPAETAAHLPVLRVGREPATPALPDAASSSVQSACGPAPARCARRKR